MAARMLVLGALNWAAEWWNPRRGSLDAVVRTAQSLVRHGLGPVSAAGDDDLARAPVYRTEVAGPAAASDRLTFSPLRGFLIYVSF